MLGNQGPSPSEDPFSLQCTSAEASGASSGACAGYEFQSVEGVAWRELTAYSLQLLGLFRIRTYIVNPQDFPVCLHE